MLVNNYNKSSTGINIEGNFFYDNDLGRMYFKESFEEIKDSLFLYTCNGEIKNDITFTVKGKKSDIVKYLDSIVMDFDWKDESKDTLLDEVIDRNNVSLSNYEEIKKELKEYGITLISSTPIEKIITRGYSQGDYAEVLYFPEKLKELWGNDVNESSLQEDINHLFWDLPIYGSLEVNGVDFHYEENLYEWEREKFINTIMEQYKPLEGFKGTFKNELEKLVPQEIPYN